MTSPPTNPPTSSSPVSFARDAATIPASTSSNQRSAPVSSSRKRGIRRHCAAGEGGVVVVDRAGELRQHRNGDQRHPQRVELGRTQTGGGADGEQRGEPDRGDSTFNRRCASSAPGFPSMRGPSRASSQ